MAGVFLHLMGDNRKREYEDDPLGSLEDDFLVVSFVQMLAISWIAYFLLLTCLYRSMFSILI